MYFIKVCSVLGVVTAASAVFLCLPLQAHAQVQVSDDAAVVENQTKFFEQFRFHMNAAKIAGGDQAFQWDADIGGDVDLIDYGQGRVNFLANMETILGEEFRAFDPNQNNYTLDGFASIRLGASEVAATFHHVSRHFSDRPKSRPIDWNMIGLQFLHRQDVGRVRTDFGARGFVTVQRSFVDYENEVGGHGRVRFSLTDRTALLVNGEVVSVGVDGSIFGRQRLFGGRLESGVRFTGDGLALELFTALERRIDADAIRRETRTWVLFGFRLLSLD